MSAPSDPVRSLPERTIAPRITGLAHVVDAAGCSLGGLVRLWGETAFRHEIVALVANGVLFAAIGVGVVELLALVGLFLVLFAVEALNTAIECIVDRISPEWSETARHAKDLGSFAVMCLLVVIGLFVAVVIWTHVPAA